ncbi:MAG: hypothetical protein PUF11_01015 [Parafannyhessea umbonata]|uniref:hypothetical protein n=1 Tax=Parafannyhessea umbonata TaxID=604330 RepID=UPI0026EEF0B8|nr:hypothetical protein [Parafannyhessea umbonata]MDD6565359.1 hypothetical protein [Parafannyhessea umbonata]
MSKEDRDKFERHFDEVAAMVPDEGEVAVLTRAELLSAMALAWACGQAHLAAGILTDPQAVFSGAASAAMNEALHEELMQRVAEACEEGARSVGVRTHRVVCNGGRDEEGDGDE